MTTELIAIIEGREMGRVARDKTGKLSFTYNDVGAGLRGIHFRRYVVGHLARRRVRNTPVR